MTVSGGFDETVRMWDLQRSEWVCDAHMTMLLTDALHIRAIERCHRTIAAHSEAVTGVDFNRDGSVLASCSYDGLIRLWDAFTGQCIKTLVHGDAAPIGHVTFSPNGFQLLATSLDNAIRLWDMANGRVLKTYSGHQNAKFALKADLTAWHAPRSDRSELGASESSTCLIVAGSEDQRLYVWHMQNKRIVRAVSGHRDIVLSVATHPRLPVLASASMDRDPCIKIWNLHAARA